MPTIDCLPIYVAQKKGIFKKHNQTVQLHTFNAQMDCDTALAGTTAQIAVTDLVRAEYLKKQAIQLAYPIATNAYWQLLAAHTSRINNPKQLGDKVVGMTRHSAPDLLTDRIIKQNKTSNSIYKIQVNNVIIRLKMLNSSQLDAAWLTEPQATQARIQKNKVIADSKEQKLTLGVIAVKTQEINQQQIDTFIKAYNEAVDSIQKYGMKTYLKTFKEQYQIDQKTIDAMPQIKFTHAQTPQSQEL